jgi:hypothetical protein
MTRGHLHEPFSYYFVSFQEFILRPTREVQTAAFIFEEPGSITVYEGLQYKAYEYVEFYFHTVILLQWVVFKQSNNFTFSFISDAYTRISQLRLKVLNKKL